MFGIVIRKVNEGFVDWFDSFLSRWNLRNNYNGDFLNIVNCFCYVFFVNFDFSFYEVYRYIVEKYGI